MTRLLLPVDAADPAGVLKALRAALTADGPAVFPHAGDVEGLPRSVPQRVALVVQTSGSTAGPKRVALSADALLASAAASASALEGSGQWLLVLPAHYIAGANVLVRSITAGTDPLVLTPRRFSVETFTHAVPTLTGDLRFTSLVPAQLAALLESDAAASALRTFDRVLVGGQSTPPALRERAAAAGVRITTTYGSSETAGGCVYDGVPFSTTSVSIVDGAVELAGPMLAEGYLDEQLTALRFHTADGTRWYRTGDSGDFDGDRLRVTGRLDRVIISGGVKVSLDAIERVIRAMPGLEDAVAVATTDDRWGEVPIVITPKPVPLDELRDLVGTALGREARPARVVVAVVPTLVSGKPDLRAAAVLGAE